MCTHNFAVILSVFTICDMKINLHGIHNHNIITAYSKSKCESFT